MSDELRFKFGANWKNYLAVADKNRILAPQQSLIARFGEDGLHGKRFLDASSGSGVFSFAAASLGAEVTAFDFDPDSVACTQALRDKAPSAAWRVHQRSLPDAGFIETLGRFDVVYCWGVAHHTGDMWAALENIANCCDDSLLISLYNDQGKPSKRWTAVKRAYCKYTWLSPVLVAGAWVRLWGVKFAADTLRGNPLRRWRSNNHDLRGMAAWNDLIDWVGGYPFEVAKPEQVFHFFRDRGSELVDFTTQGGGIGCNEFYFRRQPHTQP